MSTTSFLKTRVLAEKKALVQAAAAHAYLSDAEWFSRAIDSALQAAGAIDPQVGVAAFIDHRSRRAGNSDLDSAERR